MAVNPARIKAYLAESKTQKQNNSLFQAITAIINQLETILSGFLTIENFNLFANAVRYTVVIEIDSSSGPVSITLDDYVFNNFMIFKDISGTASGNTITLVGTVDGTVDPTIVTDYGFLQIYRSLSLNTLHQW